jgi:hypothetical protein
MTDQPERPPRTNPTLSAIEAGWATRSTQADSWQHKRLPMALVYVRQTREAHQPRAFWHTLCALMSELLYKLTLVFCITCTILFLWLLYTYPIIMQHLLLMK